MSSKPNGGDNGGAAAARRSTAKAEPKTPIWKRLWAKSGLNLPTCILMVKGSLGPVVALALFNWDAFTNYFTTVGYLVAIVTVLSFPIMPRAKFFQATLFSVLGVCIGACINLLTCYCAVKAREHTSPPARLTSTGPTTGSPTVAYNSSASAVSGIWLFFNVMLANAIRFKLPQFQSTIILYSINANISAIYAPQFPTMAAAEAFVKKLLTAFLAGFGIATVINLFVFPVTSRRVVQAQLGEYLAGLKKVMGAERDYLQSMETGDLHAKQGTDEKEDTPVAAATKALKASVIGITALHGKLAQDLIFAKREVAWGKLTAKDFDKIYKLLRQILLPSLGISSVADIFERVAAGHGWSDMPDMKNPDGTVNPEYEAIAESEKKEWNEVMRTLHEPFQELVEAMSDALTHIGYQLGITSRPKNKGNPTAASSSNEGNGSENDIEAKAGAVPSPGDEDFSFHLERRIKAFGERNKVSLHEWCEKKGLTDMVLNPDLHSPPGMPEKNPTPEAERERRHLYMILYIEFLLWSTSKAVLDLVVFADEKVASGQMKRGKLIMPGARRIKKWILSSFTPEESSSEATPDSAESGFSNVDMPNALRKKKDPEHLEPTNAWERVGEGLRRISGIMESQELRFGFRVAVATMSVAIMAFLRETQHFFISERLFWAQIMVAISMSITSGSGIFAFGLRLLGTLVAAVVSLTLWYIAGGRGLPAALLPVLFVIYLPEMWGFLKYPRYLPAFLVTMITQVLVLGYELEVEKLGKAALSSNGQAYHPIYIFAWIRLATVAAGLAVAFIWTYFPYPLTAKNAMRRRLADTIYLLASYYSCVHATIGLRIEGCGGDPDEKGSAAHQLRKTRFKIVPKILAMLTEIRQHLAFTKYEFEVGGRFPKEIYAQLVTEVNNIFNYMSLIDYATATYATARSQKGHFKPSKDSKDVGIGSTSSSVTRVMTARSTASSNSTTANVKAISQTQSRTQTQPSTHSQPDIQQERGEDEDFDTSSDEGGPSMNSAAWLRDLARVRRSINLTTEDVTSLLSLLSFSISNAQPLPPFLRPPEPYFLTARIRDIDPDILSIRHVTQPGYAAFAVTQVASRLISSDMEKLLANVKTLVGEVDFSFHHADEFALKLGNSAQKGKLD